MAITKVGVMLDEVWVHTIGRASDVVRDAIIAEEEGWDGLRIPCAPLHVSDPWVAIALATRETKRILIGTGAATPVPQIAAALAGSATSVQQASGGRAVLGIGRGDGGAAFLGMGPMPLRHFEKYVDRLQTYLLGGDVPFDIGFDGGGLFPPVATLGLADHPQSSRLSMYLEPDGETKKVPLEIFASGPKVIGIAARTADRVTFAVGAEPGRVEWAIGCAREAMAAAGRDPGEVSFGAWLPICVSPDRELARELVTGQVASMARFSSMQGNLPTAVRAEDREVYQEVHDRYTYAGHFATNSPQSQALTADFIDRFAIVGTAKECTDRLEQLVEIGLNRVALRFPAMGASIQNKFAAEPQAVDPVKADAVRYARASVVQEVLPELRARCGRPSAAAATD